MGTYTLHEAYQRPDQEEVAMQIFKEHALLDNGFKFRGHASHLLIDIYLCTNRQCAVMLYRDQWGIQRQR
eukprot:8336572-Karenia_brevis.AAC.1